MDYNIHQMLTAEKKAEAMQVFRRTAVDTGSPEVQISLLTARINRLEEHFQSHLKDRNSRRGLLTMIGHRRRLLDYLKKEEPSKYGLVISKLGLRK